MPVLALLLMSCSGRKEPQGLQVSQGQTGSLQVADRIIYDVVIKNLDPEDDWTEKCLAGLNRQELVDFIFAGIYDDRFKAFDIFNGLPIPASRIEKMEKEGAFAREQVSKIQFVEEWYIDLEDYSMIKRVTEVRLGVEHIDGFGLDMVYNPLFNVKLVQDKN